MRRLSTWLALSLALILASLPLAPVVLLAQATADSGVVALPAVDPHTAFILGMGGLAAFFAKSVGMWLVAIWNKAGGFLETWQNGSKRAFAVAFISVLGLAANWVAAQVTHNTSWILAFLLSFVGGVISVLTAGVTIDNTKAKVLANVRSANSARASGL